ncbi:MAG: response regulator transcription factor [Anaerolineae bacterium]|nr:response regulator transcription factor [Anaerolineae bacterium]
MDEIIRVLIIDDHSIVRKGLVALFDNFADITVVGDLGDARQALDLCQRTQPHVVLMDMIMPNMDGVTATGMIKERYPDIQIVALTSFDDDDNVQRALKAGAIGYLFKNATVDEVAEAVRRARRGQGTLAPEAAQSLISVATRPPAPGHDLTEREREVLMLMVEGLNNREIGEKLVISSSTVKNHVSSILDKLGTTSRTQAVALAVESKIV